MKYSGILLAAVAACMLLSCNGNIHEEDSDKYEYKGRELADFTVSVTVDSESKAAAEASNPDEAAAAALLWTLDSGAKALATWECDGAEHASTSSSCTKEGDEITFVFSKIPAEARITGITVGGEGAFGHISKGNPDIASVFATAAIEAEAGEKEITGIDLKHKCSYIDINLPFVTIGDARETVTSIKVTGTDLFGTGSADEIFFSNGEEGDDDCHWVAFNRLATDIKVIAGFKGGTSSSVAGMESGGELCSLFRIRDFNNPSECIPVSVEVLLDPAAKAVIEASDPESAALMSDLWEWKSTDVLTLKYRVGDYVGKASSKGIAIDAANPGKAVFSYPLVPKDAVIMEACFGSADAFGTQFAYRSQPGRESVFASAAIDSPAGSQTIENVALRSACSYIDVDAARIWDSQVTAVALNGEGTDGGNTVTRLNFDWSKSTRNTLCVSNNATNVQLLATTSLGTAMLASFENLGNGTCMLFKADATDVSEITYRTVVYSDGTLIVNEASYDILTNKSLHGAELLVCDPYNGTNYNLSSGSGAASQPWASLQPSITAVRIGSPIKPKNISYWFSELANLKSFDPTNLDTSECDRIDNLFNNSFTAAGTSVDLDLSSFDTRAVKNAKGMQNVFYKASGIHSIDISGWVVNSTVDCTNMFNKATSLVTIHATKSFNSLCVPKGVDLFKNCNSLVGGRGTKYSTLMLDGTYARIDGGSSLPGYFTAKNAEDEPDVPVVEDKEKTVLYSDGTLVINEPLVNRAAGQAAHGSVIGEFDPYRNGNYSGWDGKTSFSPWHDYRETILSVCFGSTVKPERMDFWFYQFTGLCEFDKTNLDLSICKSMVNTFYMVGSKIHSDRRWTLDLSGNNTPGFEKNAFMNTFSGSTGLNGIDITGWTVPAVVSDCRNMFRNCSNVVKILVSPGIDFSGVTSSTDMFYGCQSVVGGNGTTFNSSKTDKSMARVDEADKPGYFSIKEN